MKAIISVLVILCISFFNSCDENFLDEVPLDFYSPENSFVTYENFESGTLQLYFVFINSFYRVHQNSYMSPAVNIAYSDLLGSESGGNKMPDLLTPMNEFVYLAFWQPCYRMIFDANVLIERSELEIVELTIEQKNRIQAEARFFRGYLYKLLGDIYGGVPVVLEETNSPKRDYTRASRIEVYEQSVTDLKFAAENLSGINEVADHRVSNLAAWHALAEAYLSLKQWDNAINAAGKVIDDPNTALMTQRFGSRINDTYNPDFPWASGGDVYWDLFRKGNQNRSSGNTEAIWVLQFEYNVPGGSNGGYQWEVMYSPTNFFVNILNDNGTRDGTLIPTANTYYGGRGTGQQKLNSYFFEEIWNDSGFDQDIRNASHNIIRDFKVNNPALNNHGQWLFKDSLNIDIRRPDRDFWPLIAKICSMGDHPSDAWSPDQTVYGSLSMSAAPARVAHRDEYQIRLAETYLVRAEAYLGKDDLVNAAKDINVVRKRAQAPEIDPSEVDLGYILDERARELVFEENRLQTLTRLGILVERVKKYNPFYNLYDHQNLWPIPFSEIQKNTEAILEQNPGYIKSNK